MIFLIDSKSIFDCTTYSMIKPHQFDIISILENFKIRLQSHKFREESNFNLLEKLKILAQVLFLQKKSEILKLLQQYAQNTSENKQIFNKFMNSSCQEWFMEQLYVDQIQIILQQYLMNDEKFVGLFLNKIMNLYELNLQFQNLQCNNVDLQKNYNTQMIQDIEYQKSQENNENIFVQQQAQEQNNKDYQSSDNLIQGQQKDIQKSKQLEVKKNHETKQISKKQNSKNLTNQQISNLETNLLQNKLEINYTNQQGQGSSSCLGSSKDQLIDLISNLIDKKSADLNNSTNEQRIQHNDEIIQKQTDKSNSSKDQNNDQSQKNCFYENIQKSENIQKISGLQGGYNYEIPENEQKEIKLNQYTSLEGVYELLEYKYSFDSWWREFQTQCYKCKNKDEFFNLLSRKAPILMDRWAKISSVNVVQLNEFEQTVEDKQIQEQFKEGLTQNQIQINESEKSQNLQKDKDFSKETIAQGQQQIDLIKNNIQIQSQGNQTESNQIQNSQLITHQDFIQENRFSQDYNEVRLFDLNQEQISENQDYLNLHIPSHSKQSSIDNQSNEDNFVFNKGIEDFNCSNQSQSDSVILDETQTKKSLITNLEQFYKSKLVENQPQHIFPELEYMGDTQKMVEKLLFYLDYEKLDIQIEDFLAQPQINPSKILQDFVLTTYNIIKHITIHKYSTIIEVKQIEKEYLGQVIISQVNNNNQEIKKYKGPSLDIVNIVTRLIAIKKLNDKFFSEGLESVSLFQIAMSIIKRLIPGRGLFKEISEKYKKVKTPNDRQLNKIVIVEPKKYNQEQSSNSNQKQQETQKQDTKKKDDSRKKIQDKRNFQTDQKSKKTNSIKNQVKNPRPNFQKPKNQKESFESVQQDQQKLVDNDYQNNSFDYSSNYQYQPNNQGQQQNYYQEPFQFKQILNNQNQPSLQGYQGQSKTQQLQPNFQVQQTQNQQTQDFSYFSPNLKQQQYQAKNQFINQNYYQQMHEYQQQQYSKKNQFMQKGNFKLDQYSQQQFNSQKRFYFDGLNDQQEIFDQYRQPMGLRENFQKQKKIKLDYHQSHIPHNTFNSDYQPLYQEQQYSYYQPPQQQQQLIDFQIIKKMVTNLMGEQKTQQI